MEFVVGCKPSHAVLASRTDFKLFMQGIQSGEVLGLDLQRRFVGALPFEEGQEGKKFFHLRRRDLNHTAATAQFVDNQAFAGKLFQGFANGGATGSILLR
jgi:hypothetical protein